MIDSSTHLYAIFGDPVSHSKSPLIHNYLFSKYQINAVYMAFRVKNIKSAATAVRDLNFKGASITIPFKEKIIDCLDEVESEALEIGAVNTLLNREGKLVGFNTDCYGAVEPLKKYTIKGKRVGIIGAGGAARAVGFGIKKNKGKITIINRSEHTGKILAQYLSADFILLDKIEKGNYDIIINTTPVGIAYKTDSTPVPKRMLTRDMVVMDIVYNPVKTKLIRDAQTMGCHTVDGMEMLVCQGAKQFELWTGIKPSLKEIRERMINGTHTDETDNKERD